MTTLERFLDQPLRAQPHLAVLVYDKPGNFVVSTTLLRGLREKYPGCTVDFFGGERTRELEEASPLIDARFSLLGRDDTLARLADFVARRRDTAGPYDLAVNCDTDHVLRIATTLLESRYVVGRCHDRSLRNELPMPEGKLFDLYADNYWQSPDFMRRHGDVTTSSYIGELWCRLAFVHTDYHRTEVPIHEPGGRVPDVLIATGASRSAKLWPTDFWIALLRQLRADGLTVGLLGAPPKVQRENYGPSDADERILAETGIADLRGLFTLPQVAGALRRARGFTGIDNGIMHLAAAVGTPTVAIFGASPWRVWVPRREHVRLVLPTAGCTLCEDNRFKNAACLRERHACMEDVTPDRVAVELHSLLNDRGAIPSPTGRSGEAGRIARQIPPPGGRSSGGRLGDRVPAQRVAGEGENASRTSMTVSPTDPPRANPLNTAKNLG